MAQTKEKYTPNSCFQVHFQNKSLLACYSSLSSYAQGQFSKCTWMIVHPDAFKDNSAVTHKALHQFRHIHHEYGSVTLTWHCLTLLTKLAALWMLLEYSEKSFILPVKMRCSMWTLFSRLWILWLGIYGKDWTFFMLAILGRQVLSFQRLQTLAAVHRNAKHQLNVNKWNLCFRVFLAVHIMHS